MSQRTLAASRRLTLLYGALTPGAVAGAILLVIAAAELVTTYAHPGIGMALHALLLSALLVGGGIGDERLGGGLGGAHHLSRLLYSLTLIPLIRILSLSLPLLSFDQPYWYLIASVPVAAAVVVVMAMLGIRPRDVGIRLGSRLFLQLPIIALGFGLGISEYYILRPEPLIDELSLRAFVVPALILLVATGFTEELLFRGVLQYTASPVLGPARGIIYVSLVFALLHIGYRSALDVAFVAAIALIYGWAVSRTGSIIGVSLSHGLTNIMLFLVVPFIPALASPKLMG